MIDEAAIERDLRAAAARAGAHPLPDLGEAAATAGLLDVAYATLDSPLGTLLLARTARGLVRLAYVDYEGEDAVIAELASRISPRVLAAPRRLDETRRELDQYFAGSRHEFEVPIDWRLTHGFGRRVLRATARIPYGAVSSYKQVAAAAGSPRGQRAAGNALGANPIPIVVPCHRVLHSGGGLGGYTGGVERKRVLLDVERGAAAGPE
ncbi:MAG TPA: methylated-DNA--[protein]-cysteine S-methyltransferase [Solirubrobacteraceae bacterium]|nr:methylated-DNA--[protein]-cysteine S-methyltransferase [Solirubrobacteraceae bacterium]